MASKVQGALWNRTWIVTLPVLELPLFVARAMSVSPLRSKSPIVMRPQFRPVTPVTSSVSLIHGSLALAAAVGLSPYTSQLELWLEKTGRDGGLPAVDPNDETSPMYWGTLLEPIVASHYTRRTGNRVRRINAVLKPLRQILNEAADRYEFNSAFRNIKPLRIKRSDVMPFTLDEVQAILGRAREDYKPYFAVRFFTGMRTGEVHGLKWKYVDFERRLILVRESIVLGEEDDLKTDSSQRDIQMTQIVYEALRAQQARTGQFRDRLVPVEDRAEL